MRLFGLRRRFGLALMLDRRGCAGRCLRRDHERRGQVHVLTWNGDVNPVMARYIDRGIDTAERSDAPPS